MIYVNGKEVNFSQFPNGETKVDESSIDCEHLSEIILKFENDLDLIRLMFVKKYLDSLYCQSFLRVGYMPYSRMDRSENNSAFTLKYVSEFINSLNFDSIEISEPHSDVCVALLNRCATTYPTEHILEDVIKITNFDKGIDYLYFPDAGAQKRYGNINGFNQLVGFKKRDFQTGRIESLKVIGDVVGKDFKVIIVDDLCSRGGTFMLSGEKLKEIGAGEIHLIVGHCEDTIFDGDILTTDLITKVYTTDSILTRTHEKIKLYKEISKWKQFIQQHYYATSTK